MLVVHSFTCGSGGYEYDPLYPSQVVPMTSKLGTSCSFTWHSWLGRRAKAGSTGIVNIM